MGGKCVVKSGPFPFYLKQLTINMTGLILLCLNEEMFLELFSGERIYGYSITLWSLCYMKGTVRINISLHDKSHCVQIEVINNTPLCY